MLELLAFSAVSDQSPPQSSCNAELTVELSRCLTDAWWFMFYEGGPQISYYQLVSLTSLALP